MGCFSEKVIDEKQADLLTDLSPSKVEHRVPGDKAAILRDVGTKEKSLFISEADSPLEILSSLMKAGKPKLGRERALKSTALTMKNPSRKVQGQRSIGDGFGTKEGR
jgi:hypothetical protein